MLHTRPALAALVLSVAALAPGCDTVAEKLGIDSLAIPLGSAAQNIPIATAGTLVVGAEQSVTRPGPALPDLVRVTQLVINPADVTFTPASNQASNTGQLDVALVVGTYVAGMTTVTVSGGQVTKVEPTTLNIGTYDGPKFEQIKTACAASPVCTLPTLASDYATATPTAAQSSVGAALRSTAFKFGTVVRATGSFNGQLSISKVTLKLAYGS